MEILFNDNILDKIEKIGQIYPDAFMIKLTKDEWKQLINELVQNHYISVDDKDEFLHKNYLEYKDIWVKRPY